MNASYISTTELTTLYAPDLDLSGYSQATISGLISRASRMVDNFTNASKGFDFETVVDEEYSSNVDCHTDSDGNLLVPLVKRPVLSKDAVTKFTIALGQYSNDLVLTSGGVSVLGVRYGGSAIVYPNSFLFTVGTLLGATKLSQLRSYTYFVRLTYSGGYLVIPDDIKEATALFVRHILTRQYNPTGMVAGSQGSMSIRFGGEGGRTSFQDQAETLLNTYVRVT